MKSFWLLLCTTPLFAAPLPDEQALHYCLLAYASDHSFIGTALLPRLAAAGHRLRVLCRRPLIVGPRGVEVVLGDLTDERSVVAAVDGADAVVHLGAATACSARGPRPDASQQLPTTGRAHNECLLPVDSAIERPLSAT